MGFNFQSSFSRAHFPEVFYSALFPPLTSDQKSLDKRPPSRQSSNRHVDFLSPLLSVVALFNSLPIYLSIYSVSDLRNIRSMSLLRGDGCFPIPIPRDKAAVRALPNSSSEPDFLNSALAAIALSLGYVQCRKE